MEITKKELMKLLNEEREKYYFWGYLDGVYHLPCMFKERLKLNK